MRWHFAIIAHVHYKIVLKLRDEMRTYIRAICTASISSDLGRHGFTRLFWRFKVAISGENHCGNR